MPRLIDWKTIQDIDTGANVIVSMTTLQALFLQACSAFYDSRYSWVYGENDVTNEQWDAINTLQADTELALMGNMIGLILPNVLNDISNIGVLDCDGATYLKVDYPLLYDAISPAYIIDADSFVVPDLRQKFPVGASLTIPIGTVGGEEDVQLIQDEMPSHSHSTIPHSHAVAGAIASIVTVGLEPPVASALPSALTTATSGVTVNDTGGDIAHNNIPPYHAISYVIVAG